jgi:hypothetical protein
MPGSANNGSVLILTQGSACSRDIYQDHASGLYRQAFLTLGDTALAWVLSLTSSPRARAGPGAAMQAKTTWRPSCTRHCSGWRPHRPPLPKHQRNGRKMMQKLGYVTAITMAAAGAALGVMAVRSLPDARRYVAMKKM